MKVERMNTPALHLNGTSYRSLVPALETSLQDCLTALASLPEPHPRDYHHTFGNHFSAACALFRQRSEHLQEVIESLEKELELLLAQVDARIVSRT